jgi:hypothetical protein
MANEPPKLLIDEEISFHLRLDNRAGELALQGNLGLHNIGRLLPDYVTKRYASRGTVHFTPTEKGRRVIEVLKQIG